MITSSSTLKPGHALLREHADDAESRSPTRSQPDGGCAPEQLARDLSPITHTGEARRRVPGGRKRPCAIGQCWIATMGSFVPTTVMSRSRARRRTVPAPTTSGATCWTRGCGSASASSSVRSRGVSPINRPWAATRGFGSPGQHDKQIRAERLELAHDVTARAFADGREHDDRGDADRHREQHHRVRSG